MGSFLCKIWRGILRIFTNIVDAVATALKVVGTAAVDVLSEVASAIGGAIFGDGSTLLLVAGALGLYLLSKRKDRKDKKVVVTSPAAINPAQPA